MGDEYVGETAKVLPGQRVKLDVKDIRILNALAENGRYPYSTIAKKAKISRELTAYRIKRILDKKVINGFITVINPSSLGYQKYDLYLRFQKMCESKEKEIIQELKQNKNITWLATVGGNYDLGIQIAVKSISKFDQALAQVRSICGDYLNNYVISHVMHESTSQLDLFGKKAENSRYTGKSDGSFKRELDMMKSQISEKIAKIDDKDREILKILATDARATMVDISKKADLSANAVNYRVKRLIEQGVITDFIAIPSYPLLDLEWNIILLKFKNFTPDNEKKFLYFVKQHPYICYYTKGVGNWNYHISLLSKDPMHLRKILMEMRNIFKDTLHEYESIRVFNQHKFAVVLDIE